MVERVLDRVLDDFLRRGGGEAVLGLALKLRLADEHRKHAAGAHHYVFAGDGRGALVEAGALGVILEAAQQCGAQSRFMGAAIRRRDGVAVGLCRKPSASAVQATAHSTAPWAPVLPDEPVKMSGCTSVASARFAAR